jgi:hypothetical protein
MRTQSFTTRTTDALLAPCASAAVEERRPVVLTEAELTHIAAAGSKPGVASGSGVKFGR